jgi:CHAT domain-containing protein
MNSPTIHFFFCLLQFYLIPSSLYAQSANEKWHQNQDRIEEFYQSNRLSEAKPLIIYNLDLAKKSFSTESEEYRSSIFYLAQLYQTEDNYESAEQTYKKTEELFHLMGDLEIPEYGILLAKMANFYTQNSRYGVADSLFQKALNQLETIGYKRKEEYATVLKDQAAFYYEKGDFDLAIDRYMLLEKKYKKFLPHFEYMSVLLDLAAVYESMSLYDEALYYYQKCRIVQTKNQKDLNKDINKDGMLALAISGEARSFEQLGDFKAAKSAFSTVYGLYNNRKKDVNDPNEAIHQENFRCFLDEYASFYEQIGDYSTAKSIYQKIDSLGGTALQVAISTSNQALLYEAMGEYPLAEQYYLKALEVFEDIGQAPDAARAHANCLLNLAGLYELIGRYPTSEKLYLQAKQIDEMTIGQEHLDYAATLNNLANLYVSLRKYDQAEKYYDYAQRILENRLNSSHPRYIRSLGNKAFLYKLQKRYDLAEEIYSDVLKTQRKLVGKKHPDYAKSLVQLAILFKLKDETQKAEKYFQKALKLQEQTLGSQHPVYAATLNEYAQLHHYLGNRDQAFELFIKSNQIFVLQLQKIYPILSERERLKFFSKQEPYFEAFYSFASDYIGEKPSLVLELQNIHLIIKGLALETTITSKGQAIYGTNDELKSLYKKWESTKKQIAQAYSKTLQANASSDVNIDSLIELATELEIQLSKQSERFKQVIKASQQTNINFKDLEQKLSKEEAVIDFLSFNHYNGKNYSNEIRYAAFLTRSGMEQPQWINIGTEEQLNRILDRTMTQRSNNYTTNLNLGKELYRQLWMPFESFLDGISTIHLSASGSLHKVSFAAIPTDSLFLVHKYELIYHSNLRDFVSTRPSKLEKEKKAITLFGNPQFSTSPALLPKVNAPTTPPSTASVKIFGEQLKGHFYDLGGTEREVKRIWELFQNSAWETTTFLKEGATEGQIKNLAVKPQILHIATHGYFFPKQQKRDSIFLQQTSFQEKMRDAVNPLFRSGLAFAGANYIWRGRKIPTNREDGILMAYEVANMDLFGVELVTLSACDTGKGDIHNSEGVLGLQRAFKSAGVKHLILSLWRVPDQETADLMEVFYQNYLVGQELHTAFRNAQIELSKSYPPFYWAGFIFVN